MSAQLPGEGETHSHHFVRSARVVSFLTLVSRITGFARDIVFGYFFGATALASAFTVALAVPNLFRRLFGEGALSAALIPVLSRRLHESDRAGAARLAGRVFAWLLLSLAGLVVAAELIVLVLRAVPWEAERAGLMLALTGLLLPYAVLICLTAVMGGVLNVLGRFAAPAAAPILQNLVMLSAMFGAAWIIPHAEVRQIWILAWAVLVAGALQLGMLAGTLRAAGLRPEWRLARDDEGVGEVAAAMLPMMVGLAAIQINTLGDTIVALACVPHDGAPAVLYYAQRLYLFPLGVFGLALATAVFPTLSAHAATGDRAALKGAVVKSLRVSFYVGIAATLGLIVTARPLVRAFFERGEFTADDTTRVTGALVAYAVGVWAYGLNHILVRGFYAMGDRRTPMRAALAMVGINLGLNLTLVWRWEEAGLGAATAIAGIIQFFWLGRGLSRRLGTLPWRELGSSVLRALLGALAMAAAVLGANALLGGSDEATGPILRVLILVACGGAAYTIATAILGSRELRELTRR